MEENRKEQTTASVTDVEETVEVAETVEIAEEKTDATDTENTVIEDSEEPLDKNVRLMSPTRMVVRRFFRL